MANLEHEGAIAVKIVSADIIKHRFNEDPNAFEVRLIGETSADSTDGEAQRATSYMPIDGDYLPSAMQKDGIETNADRTFHDLASLGVPSDGKQLSALKSTLEGKTVEFYGKINNKGYYVYYVNTKMPEEVIESANAEAMIAAAYGNNASANAKAEPGEMFDDEDNLPFDD